MEPRTDYHERVRVPPWVTPLVGLLGVLWVASRLRQVQGDKPRWRRLIALMNTVSATVMVLDVLRGLTAVAVEVEEQSIRLGHGPRDQQIAVEWVRAVRVARDNPMHFVGGRRAFSQVGVRSGVEITAEENGRRQRYFVSSYAPEALASAVASVAGVGSA